MHPSPRRARGLFAMLALASTLSACGGGGGGGDGNLDLTATLPILLDNRTGTLTSVPEVFNVAAYGGAVALGDDFVFGSDYDTRGILSFNLAVLPPGAVISSAIVRLSARVSSGNPYAVHGLPLVDHVFVTGSDIAAVNFSGTTVTAGQALFPTFTSAFLPAEFDVTGPIRDDFEGGKTHSSFRVYFAASPELNSLDDLVLIQVSTTDPALRPIVVVTYR